MENEKLFNLMEKIYSDMKAGFDGVNKRLNTVEEEQRVLKDKVSQIEKTAGRIESKLDIVHDQTARTCKDVTLVNTKLDRISTDLNIVEAVTGKNMADIAHLKAVK